MPGTIASQLSQRLNILDPAHRYVVYNAGVVAANSAQDRDRIVYELSRGLRPYMVIVIDGPLDIVYGIYQGEHEASSAPPACWRVPASGDSFTKSCRPNIAQLLHLWFHDRAVAQHLKNNYSPSYRQDAGGRRAYRRRTADLYGANLEAMAKAVEERRGAVSGRTCRRALFSTAYDHLTDDLEFVRAPYRGPDAEAGGGAAAGTGSPLRDAGQAGGRRGSTRSICRRP